ncbi:MAG: LacI family DNA-binding transcriptional regulator [Cyclobacteriaceae bacterium]|nr:LacI family DNA-binding transcriptional regulator [Cyclobacteriaceae bacterium]
MSQKRIRIKDIAKLAGVSEGTVDRILHQRGKVSPQSAEKVNEVLKSINYSPNLIARSLSTSRQHQISVLIPNPESDPYWQQSENGLKAGLKQLSQYSIDIAIKTLYYDLHNNLDFQRAALEVYHAKPDGVLVAPLFYFASIPFFKSLKDANIPFVLFNTHIVEANALSFIGQDLEQSGALAAELVSMGQPGNSKFIFLHIDEDIPNSVHLKDKEKGFMNYLNTHKGSMSAASVTLGQPDTPEFNARLNELVNSNDLAGVAVSTSKAFLVARAFKSRNPDIRIVGYDLIPPNIALLKSNHVDFLINQNPMRQAKLGIQTMANYLLFRKKAPAKHLFPLEVITAQNVDSYLSHPGNASDANV